MKILKIIFLSIIISNSAYAWGPVGHETVANIAENYLNQTAKQNIAKIIGQDTDLADISNWADQVRLSRPASAPWHYIDIDVRSSFTANDEGKFCQDGDCVVDQINVEIAVLKNPDSNHDEKYEALKFLVHFVGDVHQPLHCADDNDRGGNDKFVILKNYQKPKARGKKLKLHALWDHLIESKTMEDSQDLANSLAKGITQDLLIKWSQGSPADWAWESYIIAQNSVYQGFEAGPSDTPVKLPVNYYQTARPIVDMQLQKAGVRLAKILNEIFG